MCIVAVINRFVLPYDFVRSAVDRKRPFFPSHLDMLQTRRFLRHNGLRRSEFQSDLIGRVSSRIFDCRLRNLLAVLFFSRDVAPAFSELFFSIHV